MLAKDNGSDGSSEHNEIYENDLNSQIEMSATTDVISEDSYNVDHAVNAFGFGYFQIKLSIIVGICWMADSMEMMILAIIGPALRCIWHLSHWKEAILTTSVFFGMMIGSTFWGYLADTYGRKRTVIFGANLLAFWGIISGFSPDFNWIVFLRALVGYGIGSLPQSVTLYAEFLPVAQRGRCIVLLAAFWALGACSVVLLALIVMPTLGWRGLIILSALPLFVFVIISFWLPESARYDAISGNSDKAVLTLQKIATENGKPMLLGRLKVDDSTDSRGKIGDLVGPELKRTSILLWIIWASLSFCYYGIVLMTTEMFESSENLCYTSHNLTQHDTCTAQCKLLQVSDYVFILWTTVAEFPGIITTWILIEKIGRTKTLACDFFLFVCSVSVLSFCISSNAWLSVILFIARGIISGAFQCAIVYTPEVYPTSLRSIGMGTCSSWSRLGAMMTPFVAQVMLRSSLHATVAVYACVGALAAVCSFLLPIETRGRSMK